MEKRDNDDNFKTQKKRIKDTCPYLFLGHNHSHPRVVLPHHSRIKFNQRGNSEVTIDEERYIQEIGAYDDIMDMTEEFHKAKRLMAVLDTLKKNSVDVHLIHIQGATDEFYRNRFEKDLIGTKEKKSSKGASTLNTDLGAIGNVLVFISNYSRNVFWTGFYFKLKGYGSNVDESSSFTMFNSNWGDKNNNNNNTGGIVPNPFITTLDLSRDTSLFKLFGYELEFMGFLFDVCPCVK
jgi:hypothetical protein